MSSEGNCEAPSAICLGLPVKVNDKSFAIPSKAGCLEGVKLLKTNEVPIGANSHWDADFVAEQNKKQREIMLLLADPNFSNYVYGGSVKEVSKGGLKRLRETPMYSKDDAHTYAVSNDGSDSDDNDVEKQDSQANNCTVFIQSRPERVIHLADAIKLSARPRQLVEIAPPHRVFHKNTAWVQMEEGGLQGETVKEEQESEWSTFGRGIVDIGGLSRSVKILAVSCGGMVGAGKRRAVERGHSPHFNPRSFSRKKPVSSVGTKEEELEKGYQASNDTASNEGDDCDDEDYSACDPDQHLITNFPKTHSSNCLSKHNKYTGVEFYCPLSDRSDRPTSPCPFQEPTVKYYALYA